MTVIHVILEAIGLLWLFSVLLLLFLIGSAEIKRRLNKPSELSLEQEFEIFKHQMTSRQ